MVYVDALRTADLVQGTLDLLTHALDQVSLAIHPGELPTTRGIPSTPSGRSTFWDGRMRAPC